MKKLICLMALSGAALLSNAHAATVFSDNHSGLGALASPGQITDTFTASAGAALLSFEIQGYASLDGANDYADVFKLSVNGTTLLTGSWDLGGGGANVIYLNPNNATVNAQTNGAFSGGKASVYIPIALLSGLNSITYSYSGNAQGLGDEGVELGQGVRLSELVLPAGVELSHPVSEETDRPVVMVARPHGGEEAPAAEAAAATPTAAP